MKKKKKEVRVKLYGKGGKLLSKRETIILMNELNRIKAKYEKLTPEVAIKEVVKKNNPFHKYFEWDRKKVVKAYLLARMRNIICCFREQLEEDGRMVERRIMLNCQDSVLGSVYHDREYVMSHEDLRQQKVKQAWHNICYWKTEYNGLMEFKPIFKAMNKVEKTLKKKSIL